MESPELTRMRGGGDAQYDAASIDRLRIYAQAMDMNPDTYPDARALAQAVHQEATIRKQQSLSGDSQGGKVLETVTRGLPPKL